MEGRWSCNNSSPTSRAHLEQSHIKLPACDYFRARLLFLGAPLRSFFCNIVFSRNSCNFYFS
jgi:hypothetical protein